MHVRRLHFALAIFLLSALPLSAQVQKPADAWAEWETLSPENEEFTVLMPKNPTTETTKFPYHKMELSARLYLATSSAGPSVGVAPAPGSRGWKSASRSIKTGCSPAAIRFSRWKSLALSV